jgi:hypothetical protein
MSTLISFEFQSNLFDIDTNSYQLSYQEKIIEKFSAKKRKRDEDEDEQIQMEEEPNEEKSFFAKNFLDIFSTLEKSDIFNEDEKNLENLYFMKDIKKKIELFRTTKSKNALFTKSKEDLLDKYLTGIDFSKKIRSSKKLPNFKQKHYIRVSIKRTFMNTYLLTALNKKLEEAGFNTFFEKFPQNIASNVAKDFNRNLLNMRLKDIFKKEELYNVKDRTNFEFNLRIVDKIEKEGNPELNVILNRKLRCLFEEYLNSEELGIGEINRLKNSKVEKDEYFIEKYIFLAKHFIEFCTQ